MQNKKSKYTFIADLLLENADAIQELATKHHKKYLGGNLLRTEFLSKYKNAHTAIVRDIAESIKKSNTKKESEHYKEKGIFLAKESLKDGLTLKEAVDGTIFLKQALWQNLRENGILNKLNINDFYDLNFAVGTYCDVLVSQITFVYHDKYIKTVNKIARHKNEFMSIATHELKTPVTSLKAYAQVLENRFAKEGNERAANQLSKMDAQLNKLTSFIGDLLDTTKIESGKLKYKDALFDLNKLIVETVEEIQRTTKKHKIKMILGPSVTLIGDRTRISQVLVNLLSNAIKYSPRTKDIIVTTHTEDKKVILSVRDYGIGIERKYRKKIFNRFQRVNDQGTYGGLGLGLFIAATIVKRHGGKIHVESSKNKGSVFVIELPVTEHKLNFDSNLLKRVVKTDLIYE